MDKESIISFITEIELQVWKPANEDDFKVHKDFVKNSKVIGINRHIVEESIAIRKNYNPKLPDAILAASCIVDNYILVADNDKDFAKIKHLEYINPKLLK